LPPFAAESQGFHQNAQKLTGNTKNYKILNNVIKYSLFCSWYGNYLKSMNTSDIQSCHDRRNVRNSKCYKTCPPKELVTRLSILAAV